MKKALILASLITFTMTSAVFAAETAAPTVTPVAVKQETPQQPNLDKPRPPRHESVFEQRLQLTDAQKTKAKELRMKSHKEIKPIMEQIKAKHQEIEAVKLSKISTQAQEEKIEALKGEMRELNKKAHEIRMKNMKEFEAILTKKQLKELEKIKKEGRKKYEQQHKKGHCPYCGKRGFKPGFGPQPPMPPKPPVEQ